MQIDFYYWGCMCPISDEIVQTLSRYKTKLDIRFHDITNNFDLAKSKNIFFPFLIIRNSYIITMGTVEKSVTVRPITKDNYAQASHCIGRRNCSGCSQKVKMYQNLSDEIIGFMNSLFIR